MVNLITARLSLRLSGAWVDEIADAVEFVADFARRMPASISFFKRISATKRVSLNAINRMLNRCSIGKLFRRINAVASRLSEED